MLSPDEMNFLEQLPHGVSGRRIAIKVKNKALPTMRAGHPWLFEDSIDKISFEGGHGDIAVIFDRDGKNVLGVGLYDPSSPVRVKILAHGAKTLPAGPALFDALYSNAYKLREPHIPPETTAWRLINGDSDGFPGLVADKYHDTLVLKIYSAAILPWIGTIAESIFKQHADLRRLCIRLSREVQKMSPENRMGIEDGALYPDMSGWTGDVRFLENGITFEADVKCGQKTGFFLDQRDNRSFAGSLSKGKTVLNMFSYSGGFSLSAAKGGASRICSVDFNKHAIAACEKNFSLNKHIPSVAKAEHAGIAGDAFQVMDELRAEKQFFDIVIVDPPSFAKSTAEVESALHSYSRLAKKAVKLTRPGGTLIFASCSSRVTPETLFDTVKNSAAAVGHPLKEFKRTFHSFDHPAKFKESSYLKCIYCTVMK